MRPGYSCALTGPPSGGDLPERPAGGQHQGGYTGFTIEITDLVHRGTENLLAVRLDTREDPSLPPFGFVIDYLTYGGLYRRSGLKPRRRAV